MQKSWMSYIEALQLLYPPGAWYGIKSLNGEVLYASEGLRALCECSEKDDINKAYYDNKKLLANYSFEAIKREDEVCIENQSPLKVLSGAQVGVDYKFLLWHKSPIINPQTNTASGIWFLIEPFKWVSKLDMLKIISNQAKPGLLDMNTKFTKQLTKREELILFLLLLGNTAKEIAIIMAEKFNIYISYHTVRNIIANQLGKKFKTKSVADLIKVANKDGCSSVIPHCILGMFRILITNL